jgi:hypothetical protein
MKAGGLFTAIGLLAILGGLVWWSNKHPSVDAKSNTPAAPKLISVDAKQIDDIKILKSGSEPIELAKLADSWEMVKPMPMHADQDAVGMITSNLATLNADRLIDEHPANLSDFGLTNPAVEVDFTLKGGKGQKLLIGSDTPANTGTYVKLEGDPKVYTIPIFTKSFFDKIPNDLRDKRLLTFNQDKLTSVTVAGKGPAVEFGKNAQGDWQIVKPKPMRVDTLLVDDLIRKLKGANMDISSTDAPEQFAKAEKLGTASTTDGQGTQAIEIRKNKDNSYYARSSAVPGIFKITNGDLGDSLSKGVDDYRNKKLFDFGFNDPSRLEINGTAYMKSTDKWIAGSNQYDAASVQSVVDKLRDLSATKFSEKMAGAQTFTVAVTSGDNHRYEKVSFNKDGDSYDAQRDGDPAVYIVDAKSVDDLQKAISAIKPYQAPKPEKKK